MSKIAVTPSNYLDQILKTFRNLPADHPKFDAFEKEGSYERLKREYTAYCDELMAALEDVPEHPKGAVGDEEYRKLQAYLIPLMNAEQVVVDLAKISANASRAAFKRHYPVKLFTDHYFRRTPELYDIYRRYSRFAQWLRRQSPQGKLRHKKSNERYEQSAKGKARRTSADYRERERMRKHHAGYRASFKKKNGFELIGPVPPPRTYRRATDVEVSVADLEREPEKQTA